MANVLAGYRYTFRHEEALSPYLEIGVGASDPIIGFDSGVNSSISGSGPGDHGRTHPQAADVARDTCPQIPLNMMPAGVYWGVYPSPQHPRSVEYDDRRTRRGT